MDQQPEAQAPDFRLQGEKWMERIRAAEKREDTWRKDAEAAEKAFSGDEKAVHGKCYDFNILHSNVETIVPAIYNSTPVPDVRRRFVEATGPGPQEPQVEEGQQPDPRLVMQFQQEMQVWQQKQQADADAKLYGDMIERAITAQIDDNKLDTEIEAEAQDAFLSGRGIVRLRLEADVSQEPVTDEMGQPAIGEDGEPAVQDVVTNERITFEAVSWCDFRMGPAKRWVDVPWIGFKHMMPRETLEKFSDQELMAMQLSPSDNRTGVEEEDDIALWEIWCKDDKTVKFVREHDGKVIKIEDDPLGLAGFYPMPPLVQPITLTGKMTPVCPFTIYKKLADELDLCTKRIAKIMSGLKVRGIAIGDGSEIAKLASAGDNEIVMADNLEQLSQTGGIEKAIMWWPVEQAIKVLQQLYVQRDQIKASIYEITGISDIIRGASQASETATAQQIKTQWGSLRIQKMQRLIERQVRDVFCLMSEIITKHFSEKTLTQMTGIEITDGVRALMQESIFAGYRVDVESDSTVRADLTRVKQDMAEFMTGTANFFGTMGPVVAEAPEMAEPMAEVYSSFARVFKLGKQAEDALERMAVMAKAAASKPKEDPAAQIEQQRLMLDYEHVKAQMGLEVQKLELEAQRAQTDAQRAEVELAIKQADLQLREADARLKGILTVAEMEMEDEQQRAVKFGGE